MRALGAALRDGIRSIGFDVVRYKDKVKKYHHLHRAKALGALAVIESENSRIGQYILDDCNQYAKTVLGSLDFAPWLYVYAAVSGAFKIGWIPDNYYGLVVVPKLKGRYGALSDLRVMSNLLFRTALFPDLAYVANGSVYSSAGERIGANDMASFLFRNGKKVIFKAQGSSRGKGITVFSRESFAHQDPSALQDGVFQSWIDQHPSFVDLSPSAVATLRLTTTIDTAGRPKLSASYLRLGRKDELYVKSQTAIRIAVDPETGTLADRGYNPDWSSMQFHPDTQARWSGRTVPLFAACREEVVKLHARFPYAQCIGWDLVVDSKENIQVMEWNGLHNDIRFSEASQGPCFADLGWETLWQTHPPADVADR